MVWFRVDDGFPTSRKVVQIPRRRRAAAIGVWTMAGAWSAHELTDGFIPRAALDEIPDGKKCAADLVSVDLWHYADGSPMPSGCFPDGCPMDPRWIPEGGWLFHDWSHYQPSKQEVTAKRSTNAARQQAFRERKNNERNAVTNALQVPLRNGVTNAAPTRPDPTQSLVPTELREVRANRATRIPDDFAITEAMRAWAATEVPGMDIDLATKKFVLHFQAASGQRATMIKWDAAWKKWMLSDYKPPVTQTSGQRLFGKPGERKSYY